MRIFRWLLLIANVIVMMLYVIALVTYAVAVGSLVNARSLQVIAPLLAVAVFNLGNIVFILITWRWRHEGRAVSRIAGAFD